MIENKAARESKQLSNSPGQGLEKREMWNQLANAISLRSAQDQVLWSIFGAFWAVNAILLVALFTTGKLPESIVVGIVVSSVGMLISLIWHFIQKRALGHVERYEELMRKLEAKLGFDASFAVSAKINREDYGRYVGKGIPARQVMPVCSLGGAILWALAVAFFIFNWYRS